MIRLLAAQHRLYVPTPRAAEPPRAPDAPSADAPERVRAFMLGLSRPADWATVSLVWQAVQRELALPAPAIAVSGTDGFQLWFSLAEAVPMSQAQSFLEGLCARHWGHVSAARIERLTSPPIGGSASEWPLAQLPPRPTAPGQWSAFVAPDLAPVFADTPWLDTPPNPEGQADLLSPLRSIAPADWLRALQRLHPAPTEPIEPAAPARAEPRCAPVPEADPRRFLTQVMGDESVPLALRIKAARALLRHAPFPT